MSQLGARETEVDAAQPPKPLWAADNIPCTTVLNNSDRKGAFVCKARQEGDGLSTTIYVICV